MKRLYCFATPVGTFYIAFVLRYYFAWFESMLVDSYPTPEAAACDLSRGRALPGAGGISSDKLDIPADLREWQRCD